MKNYIAEGDVFTVPAASGGFVSGTMYLIGDIAGVAVTSASEGVNCAVAFEGVHELPKASGAVAVGKTCYWDDSAKKITGTAASNKIAGYAYEAAASGDATIKVALRQS